MVEIKLSGEKIFKKKTLMNALWIGLVATFIEFLLSFFGIDILFGIIPTGFKVLVVVTLSVLISTLFIVKHKGKEVI